MQEEVICNTASMGTILPEARIIGLGGGVLVTTAHEQMWIY